MSLYCILAYIVSNTIILILVLPYIMCPFSLAAFKIFSLFLFFISLNVIGVFPEESIYPVWWFSEHTGSVV